MENDKQLDCRSTLIKSGLTPILAFAYPRRAYSSIAQLPALSDDFAMLTASIQDYKWIEKVKEFKHTNGWRV